MNTRVERLERDMVACSAASISAVGVRLPWRARTRDDHDQNPI
eukprot:SAG25_NODE_191_length_12265_cov_16.310538_1_plen_43_part_00